eukprot:987223-Amphidinium_carterae.2
MYALPLSMCDFGKWGHGESPQAVTTLVRTNTLDAHWKKCWMDEEDLDELYEDIWLSPPDNRRREVQSGT